MSSEKFILISCFILVAVKVNVLMLLKMKKLKNRGYQIICNKKNDMSSFEIYAERKTQQNHVNNFSSQHYLCIHLQDFSNILCVKYIYRN